jgi:hypothetical protein
LSDLILPFPDKKYQIIYADPPWRYRDKRKNPKTDRPRKYGGIGYPTMTVEEICGLPIKNISDDNCILFIWVTFPILEEVFKNGYTYFTTKNEPSSSYQIKIEDPKTYKCAIHLKEKHKQKYVEEYKKNINSVLNKML